jgi:hypothetical protein
VRRAVAWLAGLGTVIIIGVPAGQGLLVTTDGGDDASGPPAIEATTDTSTAAARPAERGATTPTPDAMVEGARADVPTTLPGAGSGPAPAGGADRDGYPAAAWCSVDNTDLGPGEERLCRFTATERGGASMHTDSDVTPAPGGPKGRVIVTRDGVSTTHQVEDDKARAGDLHVFSCGSFIEPGDLVEVVLTNATITDGSSVTLGAGDGWECWNAG